MSLDSCVLSSAWFYLPPPLLHFLARFRLSTRKLLYLGINRQKCIRFNLLTLHIFVYIYSLSYAAQKTASAQGRASKQGLRIVCSGLISYRLLWFSLKIILLSALLTYRFYRFFSYWLFVKTLQNSILPVIAVFSTSFCRSCNITFYAFTRQYRLLSATVWNHFSTFK